MTKSRYELRTLFWEATLKCNAYCSFCGSRCGDVRQDEADGDTVVRMFRRVAEAYEPSRIMVNVTGGEPLLRSDLFSVMEKVNELGFSWGMVTNGSLITEEIVSYMKQTGMKTISISLDALGEAHNRIRKLNRGFERIVRAIRLLKEADFLDELQITTVVTKKNLRLLPEMYAYFRKLPVDSWRLAPVDPIGRARENKDIMLDAGELGQLLDFMDEIQFDEKLQVMTSCSHYLGNKDTLYRNHPFRCETGKNVASILADGSIYVCPNVPRRPELIQGNIQTDDFVKCWEEGFQWFRDEKNKCAAACKTCPEWERCKGDCTHTWDFDSSAPAFCYIDYGSVEKTTGELPEDVRKALRQEKMVESEEPSSLKGIRISYGSSSSRVVFFTPYAAEELLRFFHWGETLPENSIEQMVAIAGYERGGQAFVDALIPVELLDSGSETATFPLETHTVIKTKIEEMNSDLKAHGDHLFDNETYRFLGYIHSHPGDLEATMSIPDISLHRWLREKEGPRVISGIMNPQKKDLCLYSDSVYYPMDVILLVDKEPMSLM